MRQNRTLFHTNVAVGISLIACIAGYFGLLSYYSFDISSDDALYFQRALNHFSVLEFSPHFPGYPGFVWLERLISTITSHPNSNVLVSFISAIALTVSVFIYCYQHIRFNVFSLLAVLLFLLQGNLAELAFNGLSDASALWFFSLYLLLTRFSSPVPSQTLFASRPFSTVKIRSFFQHSTFNIQHSTFTAIISGLLLAACLATRPSYLPLVVSAMLLSLCYPHPQQSRYKQLGWQIISITLIGLICAFYVFMQDGWAYIEEGQRFTQGHFTIWGNTTSTADSLLVQWLTTLTKTYSSLGLVLLTLVLIVGLSVKNTRGLSILACCWFAWIMRGQNPENIRHLAVFSLLLPIITAQLVEHFYIKISHGQIRIRLALSLFTITLLLTLGSHSLQQFNFQQVNFQQGNFQQVNMKKNAPVLQASQFFQAMEKQQIIISNYNIDNLRHNLPQHVILDRHYQSSSHYQAQQQGYWRLSSNRLEYTDRFITEFNGRFLGERDLYLYYFDPNHFNP